MSQLLEKYAVGVLRIGVSGYLKARCRTCSGFIRVAMDKERGPKVLDVNTKLATGMYHIGIGPTQMNNFLLVINLPTPSTKTIQRRCEEVGSKLEELASESTDLALLGEVALTNEGTNEVVPSAQTPETTDSADRLQHIGIPAPVAPSAQTPERQCRSLATHWDSCTTQVHQKLLSIYD